MRLRKDFAIKALLSSIVLVLPALARANTLTDVGLGPTPDFAPAQGTTWTLSSSCVDINEAGEAACQSQAVGPTYGCRWRNAQRCSSKVKLVHLWDGSDLIQMSRPDAEQDVPLAMNNNGEIGGYAYVDQVYPSYGGNGRIWSVPGTPEGKESIVTSLNDSGDYVLEWLDTPGGIRHYTSSAFLADGTEIVYPGDFVRAFAIGNSGDVIGAQILQTFVLDIHSPTGDEIPEVSGVGWLFSQQEVDDLPINEAGLYDIDGDILWPARFYRPMAFTNYATTVSDVNDFGEFAVQYRFGGLFSSRLCSPIGESQVSDPWGRVSTVPWVCESSNYHGGTYAGGKSFRGINNIGDAVGAFTPGAYSYQSTYTTHPWVWLKNNTGGWDEFNANDLLPAGSGYTVISIADINDSRQIAGTCANNAGELRGCILDLTDNPVPPKVAKPTVTINSPVAGAIVSSPLTIEATAWDRDGFVKRVVFRVDKTKLSVDRTPPYTATWNPADFAPGPHTIKVIAIDNDKNRRVAKINVTVAAASDPGTPGTPPAGEAVEGEGTITAVGAGSIGIDGVVTYYDGTTVIKFNDVSDFAVGLAVQYKGTIHADGTMTATDLEVN